MLQIIPGMRRIFIILLILFQPVLTVYCDSGREPSALLSYVSNPRLSSETRIFDNAGLIKNKKSLDEQFKGLFEIADIDIVAVTFTDLQGNDIDDIADRLFSSWKIGENTNGQRGVMFLLSVEEELVRFETGLDLKWIYPDSFVQYIEREQMVPYFESGRIQTGITASLEMIIARAGEEIEGGLYDP